MVNLAVLVPDIVAAILGDNPAGSCHPLDLAVYPPA
jgi:hypothetical protein